MNVQKKDFSLNTQQIFLLQWKSSSTIYVTWKKKTMFDKHHNNEEKEVETKSY